MARSRSYLQGFAWPERGARDDPPQGCQAGFRAQGGQVCAHKAVGSRCQQFHIRRRQGVLEASQPCPEQSNPAPRV